VTVLRGALDRYDKLSAPQRPIDPRRQGRQVVTRFSISPPHPQFANFH
jgi:hypothetical protein